MKKIIFLLFLLIAVCNPVLAQESEKGDFPYMIVGPLFAVFIFALFFLGVKKSGDKLEKTEKEYYQSLAMKLGYEFHENDTFCLAQELENTPFKRATRDQDNFLKNILTKSDNNSNLYLFYRFMNIGDKGHHLAYTICFYKMNSNLDVDLIFRLRAPGFLEKAYHSQEGPNLNEVKFEGQEAFNKRFIVYADKQDVALKLFNPAVLEYCCANMQRFVKPTQLNMKINNDRLIVFTEHINLNKNFKDEAQFENFVDLARGLKGNLVR